MSRKKDAIELKLTKAKALMEEVDFQLKNQYYNTAINRLYYSCFHAAKALLLTRDLVPKSFYASSSKFCPYRFIRCKTCIVFQ